MLGPDEVNRVDRAGLWRAYEDWPGASTRALKRKVNLPRLHSPRLVVLAGMGGSGAACDVVADWLGVNSRLPTLVVKDFHLPMFVGKGALVIAVSLSGDTKEVLSVLEEALGRGCDVIALSSGGALEVLCKRKGVPHNRVERQLVPRASLPSMVITTLRILEGGGVVDCGDQLDELPSTLREAFSRVSPLVPLGTNPAKKLAKMIQGRRAAVYTPSGEFSVGHHFSASMNENAKVPVYAGAYPEIFHNEIETWRSGEGRAVVLVRHRKEDARVRRKLARSKSLLAKAGVPVGEVYDSGRSASNLLGWCLLLDMVSIYSAVLRKIPPIETPLLDAARKL